MAQRPSVRSFPRLCRAHAAQPLYDLEWLYLDLELPDQPTPDACVGACRHGTGAAGEQERGTAARLSMITLADPKQPSCSYYSVRRRATLLRRMLDAPGTHGLVAWPVTSLAAGPAGERDRGRIRKGEGAWREKA